jgi:putative heme-binding domain-containing protein
MASAQDKLPPGKLFAQDNLVAWCIVPFDAQNRGPEQRAAMLKRLGFTKFAYDYRAEHIPTFDAEINALQKQGIELTAWWFPQTLNAEARQILDVLKRHKLKTQLWVTGGGAATKSDDERAARTKAEAARIRPIAEEASKIGCTVGLYNHGGWFGEPENQIAIIEELKLPNVGLVYNLHHGHDHLDRFTALLAKMLPNLWCLNLNGMVRDGEAQGRKILPLGQGDLDLDLLKTIVASGYRGPIGILGHTQDDAEQRLADNLDGLRWLVAQLEGQPAGPRPIPRTPVPPPPAKATSTHGGHHAPAAASVAAVLPAEFDAQVVADLLAAARNQGDARRGIAVFGTTKFACLSCHQVGRLGGSVGPALTDVGKRLKPEEIAEAVLWPKRQVKPEYVAWRFRTADGRTLQGYKRSETAEAIELFDPTTQRTESLAKAQIDEQQEAGTLMPDGLAAAMTDGQRRDLVRLLLELGHTTDLENEVAAEGAPAEFAYDRAPLDKGAWLLWEHPVNRDRVYDFYRKEALFFRGKPNRPHLLPAFPGLDGGKLGHWGNQNEEVWKDDRWNQTDLGTLLCGVFHGPGGIVVPKGVCVRLGDQGELAACFNPETLSFEAVWRGGFIGFTPVRHGFLDGLRPAGQMLPRLAATKPTQPFEYHGFYRLGPRVVFAYRLGDVEMLDSAWVKDGQFERTVAPLDQHPLRSALRGGPAQWPKELKTAGELGPNRPYTVDTIKPPFENPWKALLFLSDHDFLPDGSALIATMTGDVWRVTGLDDRLDNLRWRRFASGLHQPLGVVIENDDIFVLGRDQITRLKDSNSDGEADFYECISNKMQTSSAGHDFICGLARDKQGRFLTASGKQGLIRISTGGEPVEVLATGFRNPDGLAVLNDGAVTLPCSEGDWTPASMICLVTPDTQPPPHFGYMGPIADRPPALPMVYLPRGLDNSSGGQAVVADPRFGPLAGQIIHLSFGQGSHFLVLRDEVEGQPQGAVVPLPGEFRSGVHRGKVNPRDGQLYVSGMAGWGSYTPDDGCFHRVRYTGTRIQLPRSLHIHENGLLISFVEPVDWSAAARLSNHLAQVWNYRYSSGYGSPELAPSHPGVVGHEVVEIAGVHAIDERTLFVEIPELQPVNQLHLLLQVDQGPPQELFVTVHRLDKPFTEFPGYQPRAKTIAAHPQDVDLALLGKSLPNPWGKRGRPTPTAMLEIEAGKNLTFSTRLLRVKAGQRVQLTFNNPDVVPHNWVLARPQSLATVGDLANKLIADPEAVLRQYVPKTDDVVVYTDIVPPQQSFTIWFDAPAKKGRYPYLCTFPGHWMVMNGELLVE